MSRHFFLIFTVLLLTAGIAACGGVAQNPTQPSLGGQNKTGPGGQQTGPDGKGTAQDLLGQLSGGGQSTGEEVISGTYDMLWPQGINSMDIGDLMNAGRYFKSALLQNPQSADAAIAYAVVDAMREFRRNAVFCNPGVSKLFTNTPIIGHAEVWPNPFLADDSYFLRLSATGYRVSKLTPTSTYPTLAPIDTERLFTPENLLKLGQLSGNIPQSPGMAPPAVPGSGPGGTVNPAPPEETKPADDDGNPEPDAGGRAGRGKTKSPKLPKGKQNFNPGTTDTSPVSGAGPRDGFGPVLGGPAQPKILPEREESISEDEWETLIKEYRDYAVREAADIVLSQPFYSNLSGFRDEIEEHINNLELVRSAVEVEGYALALPFDITDGTSKVTFQFDLDDYKLLLEHYRLIYNLLTYVLAYNHQATLWFPTVNVEDTNGDNVFSPDEYLPPAPFGTIDDAGKKSLAALQPDFVTNLNDLSTLMDKVIDAAKDVKAGDPEKKEIFYLSGFRRNFVLIEQWKDLIKDIATNSTTGMPTKLAGENGITEATVVFDSLFSNPVEDIRIPLPSFNSTDRTVIADETGKWSTDNTFGGFFKDGLDTTETYIQTGRLMCWVFDNKMGKAAQRKIEFSGSDYKTNETGMLAIDNAKVNELIGTPYSVPGKDKPEEVKTGVLRSLGEIIPLFDINILTSL
ncbi:MAG: hypothetical protein ABIC40_06440, partial [bacterium]